MTVTYPKLLKMVMTSNKIFLVSLFYLVSGDPYTLELLSHG
jgi:hypothetical protein